MNCFTCNRPKPKTLKQRGSTLYCPEDQGCHEYAAGFRDATEAAQSAIVAARTAGRKEIVALLRDIVTDSKVNAEHVAKLGIVDEGRARALAAMIIEDALSCAGLEDTSNGVHGIIDLHPRA